MQLSRYSSSLNLRITFCLGKSFGVLQFCIISYYLYILRSCLP